MSGLMGLMSYPRQVGIRLQRILLILWKIGRGSTVCKIDPDSQQIRPRFRLSSKQAEELHQSVAKSRYGQCGLPWLADIIVSPQPPHLATKVMRRKLTLSIQPR